jgi:hypothetical protein
MMTTYKSLNWRDRAKGRQRATELLNDTLAAYHEFYWQLRMADVALSPYGVRLIPNDRVFHIFEDWPGLDRRKVSGSVWDGRKLIWRRPEADRPLCWHCSARWEPDSNGSQIWWLLAEGQQACIHCCGRRTRGKLRNGPKVRCAHRTWKSAKQLVAASRESAPHLGIGRAWEEDTAARDVLRVLKEMALDRGAPVPLCRQQEALTGRSSESRSYISERGVAYPGAAIGHGGATSQEKRRVTIFNEQVNAGIALRRDLESKPLEEARDWQLDIPGYWSGHSKREGKWVQSVRLGAATAWSYVILHQIYDVGTAPLKEPSVGPCKALPRADVQAFALAEWFEVNHRRAQMRKEFPEPVSGPCRKLGGDMSPGVSMPGGLACGWRGGRCCRRISCPLNDCRVAWVARRRGGNPGDGDNGDDD